MGSKSRRRARRAEELRARQLSPEPPASLSCSISSISTDDMDPPAREAYLKGKSVEAMATEVAQPKRKCRSSSESGTETTVPETQPPKKAAKRQDLRTNSAPAVTQQIRSTPPTPLMDIKGKSVAILEEAVNFACNGNNSLSNAERQFFLSRMQRLGSLLDRALFANNQLQGELNALKSICRTRTPEPTPPTNAWSRPLHALTKAPSAPTTAPAAPTPPPPAGMSPFPTRPPTYAQKLRQKIASISSARTPSNVLAVVPDDAEKYIDSEATKKALLRNVSLATHQLKFTSVRTYRGNGLILKAEAGCNLSPIIANAKLKAAGLKIAVPEMKNPRVIVYDVPRCETDKNIVDKIIGQNFTSKDQIAQIKQQTKVAFKSGPKNKETYNVIFEVTKSVRDLFLEKGHLYIDFSRCSVRDYAVATRCYKCHSFGHTTKHCRAEKEICGHCATPGHNFKSCPNKSKQAICSNCRKNGKEYHHSVTSRDCPCQESALNRVLSRINYA